MYQWDDGVSSGEGFLFPHHDQGTHVNFHDKTVQLSFWQREGALIFNWILGRHDDKGFRQWMGYAINGDLPFLHGFQQSRLCAGVARLISSARARFTNTGPGRNSNALVV